jgi:Flp pilus assembly protein TadB
VKPDLELDDWREQWQADTEVPADLRRKVERGSRNMRLLLAAEVLTTVLVGGGATLWAAMDPRTEMVVLSVAVWLFFGAAWMFTMMNRRGMWSPAAVSTSEFLDLSVRRCRMRLLSSGFGAGLYVAEMVFCLIWLYWDPARREPLPAVIFGVATPVFVVWLVRDRRKTRAELERLLELQRQSG